MDKLRPISTQACSRSLFISCRLGVSQIHLIQASQRPPPTPHAQMHIRATELASLWAGENHRVSLQGDKVPIITMLAPKQTAQRRENDVAERSFPHRAPTSASLFRFSGESLLPSAGGPGRRRSWVTLAAALGWWPQRVTTGLGSWGCLEGSFSFSVSLEVVLPALPRLLPVWLLSAMLWPCLPWSPRSGMQMFQDIQEPLQPTEATSVCLTCWGHFCYFQRTPVAFVRLCFSTRCFFCLDFSLQPGLLRTLLSHSFIFYSYLSLKIG